LRPVFLYYSARPELPLHCPITAFQLFFAVSNGRSQAPDGHFIR
jgi:hypothetical protein